MMFHFSRREFDRRKMAHDASHFYLVPEGVATPRGVGEVVELLRFCRNSGRPLTFRSGGSSLSGQGITDGVLADTRKFFRRVEVLDDGARVRVEPGATVRQVNGHLLRYGRKLGPDPASEIACTIGGVIANNSSGMSCGIEFNAYNTVESLEIILASGTLLDTAAPDADEYLRAMEPGLYSGLSEIRQKLLASGPARRRVVELFAMKNTMGYGMNAFLDFERPVDILRQVMIGNEGTLGFVASATFHTVPRRMHAATGLAVFENLSDATAALPDLVEAGFATIELLDATSLQVAQGFHTVPQVLAEVAVEKHAALLLEVEAEDEATLQAAIAKRAGILAELKTVSAPKLAVDPTVRNDLWNIRKGLYTAIAEARPAGTVALLEDIVVPIPQLLHTCSALEELFSKYQYDQAVIFGHAKDGNIHFMITEDWEADGALKRYADFTDDLVELVLNDGGSLKAEHGTGRIMAPFVQRQYGDEIYKLMLELKQLCDPDGILNPGVIIPQSTQAHLENLKTFPRVEQEVDRCVECGYCEPVCPSQDLTTTPRQRIAIRREMQAAKQTGQWELLAQLQADYDYEGTQTCAVDGMCATACPVNIDTGDLTRRLRQETLEGTPNPTTELNANAPAITTSAPATTASAPAIRMVWEKAAAHWHVVTRMGATALTLARSFPPAIAATATKVGRKILGSDVVPSYSAPLPRGGLRRKPQGNNHGAQIVFFPACIGTIFGPATRPKTADTQRRLGATQAFLALCERAGIEVVIPEEIESLCCGTPWSSKGVAAGLATMKQRVEPALRAVSDQGRLPIICDAASCTEGLHTMLAPDTDQSASLTIIDAVAFLTDRVLPQLPPPRKFGSLLLHPTCSSTKLDLNDDINTLAKAIAKEVVTPVEWHCCAFAGDRGLLHPELTQSATRAEANEISAREFDAYASVNKTCEIGMTRATGHEYWNLIELLEVTTR